MPELFKFGGRNPVKKVFEITSFAGIDLSSAPSDISKNRSPDALNMMPDSKGNPIKRTGFALFGEYGERINGIFCIGEHFVVHAGNCLFVDGEKVFEGMGDEISSAQVFGEKLYIFDGHEPIVCDGTEAWPLYSAAYIPTVLISKNADFAEKEIDFLGDGEAKEFAFEQEPKEIISVAVNAAAAEYFAEDGKIVFSAAPEENAKIVVKAVFEQEPGGSIKEEFNLISSRWKESFICDTGTETQFSLSKTGLSSGRVKAWVMDENGTWQEKTEKTDFTVDREAGKILFIEPVAKTPVAGTDNLIIEAEKYFEGYPEKINLCRQSIAFDAAGTSGRIFVCGNPNEPEKDFWCAAGNPEYWPDTYYSEIGKGGGRIIGYSVMGNLLASYISEPRDGRSIVVRSFALDENGNASFPVEKHLMGEEAISEKSFVFMDKEQLFLTGRGVYAITTEDISGEKYTQNRSYYINKALCEEELEKAFCAKWKNFYVIAAGEKIYLLDTGSKSYEKGEPLSAFQYECYLWNGINARVLCEREGILFFGDEKGRIFYFTENGYSDWSENGQKAIEAYWTFPDFMGEHFFLNKTIKMLAVQAAAFPQNEVCLEVRKNGFWEELKKWTGKISFFAWDSINWGNFTWSGDFTPRTLTLKAKIKKFDKCRFRVSCSEKDKAFGLYGFAAEYSENGRYKK